MRPTLICRSEKTCHSPTTLGQEATCELVPACLFTFYSFPPASEAEATLAFLLFLKHTSFVPAAGPLHLLFPLPGKLLSPYFIWAATRKPTFSDGPFLMSQTEVTASCKLLLHLVCFSSWLLSIYPCLLHLFLH